MAVAALQKECNQHTLAPAPPPTRSELSRWQGMQPEVNPKNLGVKMLRRDFGKVALGAIASSALLRSAKGANVTPAAEFPKTPGLTDYVGRFVVNMTYEDIPADVIELGKKSILDGLGLALAGSRAQTGTICRQYLEDLSICGGKAIVIGSALKTSPRFAAFVNGVSIHADDFDDTQLDRKSTRLNSSHLVISYAVFCLKK